MCIFRSIIFFCFLPNILSLHIGLLWYSFILTKWILKLVLAGNWWESLYNINLNLILVDLVDCIVLFFLLQYIFILFLFISFDLSVLLHLLSCFFEFIELLCVYFQRSDWLSVSVDFYWGSYNGARSYLLFYLFSLTLKLLLWVYSVIIYKIETTRVLILNIHLIICTFFNIICILHIAHYCDLVIVVSSFLLIKHVLQHLLIS